MTSKMHTTPQLVILVATIILLVAKYLPAVNSQLIAGKQIVARHHRRTGGPIPTEKAKLNSWFERHVAKMAKARASAEPTFTAAHEGSPKVITVKADGSGQFKTITEAVNSIPHGNNKRVIVSIGPGNYTEKVKIERYKPFITFYGDANSRPIIVFNGTAKEFGTDKCGTLIVESDYFMAVNMIVVNSAPRPDGKMIFAQAVAMRIKGDRASFFNCSFHGFQDTLMDDTGKHLYKDCYIEGTVDFIFGSGQTLYLNTEIHVIPGDQMAIITAHARKTPKERSGYVFVHCNVTGTGQIAHLGRSWFAASRVIFAYCDMSDVVNPKGWSDHNKPSTDATTYFGEFRNKGPGAALDKRVLYAKKMTKVDVRPYLNLGYIEGSKWLRLPTPPPTVAPPKHS